jgi:hypothetical protein
LSALIETQPDLFQTYPFLFIVFFVALWCLILFLISVVSGWHSLARRFRCTREFARDAWTFRSAYMRYLSHYGTCLSFGADSSGLYLSVFPIFRVGHPPLFIPWSEVTVTRGETGIPFFKRRKLLLGREESIPLSISVSLAENLQRAAGPAWPHETPAP